MPTLIGRVLHRNFTSPAFSEDDWLHHRSRPPKRTVDSTGWVGLAKQYWIS